MFGFSIILILKEISYVLKQESILFVEQKYKLNQTIFLKKVKFASVQESQIKNNLFIKNNLIITAMR